jgi:drug/metabolite transporter (DMT)-like permease
MTTQNKPGAKAHITPAGLMFLAITSLGWGFNWPVTKFLLSELPPLTLRGSTGVIGAGLLAVLAVMRGQSLKVSPELWPRLMLAAALNVGAWMVLMGLALLWLPASEAALIAYTMPVWASLLAWFVLGERITWLRVFALVMAFAGLAAIMGANGISASAAKLPGIIMALAGSAGFALGTVLAKKLPLQLPPITAAAWQIGLGCFPVAVAGLLIETSQWDAVTELGWLLVIYSTVVQFCIAYVGGGDRHHGGAGDRRRRLGNSAARAAWPRPDRRAGVHTGRRSAGDAVIRNEKKAAHRVHRLCNFSKQRFTGRGAAGRQCRDRFPIPDRRNGSAAHNRPRHRRREQGQPPPRRRRYTGRHNRPGRRRNSRHTHTDTAKQPRRRSRRLQLRPG